jgi:5-methylcytosine-specific restriction endonuclease McrA
VSRPPPSPAEQVAILHNFQRLLAEGAFVATYKYALLQALSDLAVAQGDDSGEPLALTTAQIAGEMIRLYWRQAVPFPVGGASSILRQNTGNQAAILSRVLAARQGCGGSLARLRQDADAWAGLVREVAHVVRVMPLWKLQRVGDQVLDFLYPNVGRGSRITLRPGVAYCLRTFHTLLADLIRGAWLRHVRRFNADLLGDSGDLGSFLFGSERASLAQYGPALLDIQTGRCFYCHRPLGSSTEVDHFVPWARYPNDLGHNIVLAHAACNRWKSDHLAAEPHLESWLERNRAYRLQLAEAFDRNRIVHDLGSSTVVAHWAYSQAHLAAGQVWVEGRTFSPLTASWRDAFTRAGGSQ